MKNKSGILVIGVLAVLIGLVISIQASTIQGEEQGALIPLAKFQSYEVALQQARAEREAAVQALIEAEEKLTALQQEKADEDDVLKAMLADEEKYKIAAGLVEVKGPGVTITLEDPASDEYSDGYSVIMVRYELLLSLVNKLKDAGAEAVSINGQRIIATTEISLAGNNVNINGVATAPPYTIKAIGNPQTIEGAITIRQGVVEVIKSYGIKVSIAKQEEVVIPRYSGTLMFRYAEVVKNDSEAEADAPVEIGSRASDSGEGG